MKPHIVAAWTRNGKLHIDGYAVVDTPRRRQCMQDWCAEMNRKHGAGTHWIHEFLADGSDDFDATEGR